MQTSHFRLIILCYLTEETQSSGYLKTNTSDMMSKRSIYHLEESHLTSMDRLLMRPGGQQQEEQENVGKQPIPKQISHLLLSDSRLIFLFLFSVCILYFRLFSFFSTLYSSLIQLSFFCFLLFSGWWMVCRPLSLYVAYRLWCITSM